MIGDDISTSFARPAYADTPRKALLEMVPLGLRRVLDVGCNQGGFGAALKAREENIEVWGVEPDAASAAIAANRLDRVLVSYFQEDASIPDRYFDLIVFNDSLDHMVDPLSALLLAGRKLRPEGRVHCCVPNMRHVECLEHLLLNKNWAYEETGVRDRTHLRFFTQRSIIELFRCAGYSIINSTFINENWWEPDKRSRRLLFRLFPKATSDMKYMQVVVTAMLNEPAAPTAS